jgi:hypothetical protein
MRVPEEFIYYLWKLNLLTGPLQTVDGQKITIINPGVLNQDSGPDFFNARIKIGDTEWAGNVEMHSAASDWIKHGHNKDKAYDSVILHVVYDCDTGIKNSHNEVIPCLSVKGHYPESVFFRYRKLISARDWIPCAANLKEVGDLVIFSWLDRLVIERLERKTANFEKLLEETGNDWEETFYITLARNFGFNTNSQPFENLARSLPVKIIAKHKDDIFQIEALLFGQAGLLNEKLNDEYNRKLLKEYLFLKKKYGLDNIKSYSWKFMRMRPVNFPTIRIAQFAQLLFKSKHLLSSILEIEKYDKLKGFFDVGVSDYWLDHYTFGTSSKKKNKTLGASSFDLILINTIVPFLYVYGKRKDNRQYINRAILFLQQTKAENNGIIKRWAASGVTAANAAQSQALLTLKNDYCSNIRCLDCAIGNKILNQ